MRKLASVRKINEIKEHPNADALELAIVGGWQCVVAKGRHSKGEMVAFFEIDSFIPVRDEYEFLRKGCLKNLEGVGEGFRIRTVKLRKELSQGLVMPLNEVLAPDQHYRFPVDSDMTEALGVVKYEKYIPSYLRGKAKWNFPSRIPKTDQERIQNIFGEFDPVDSLLWEVTLKLDGSSMTCYIMDAEEDNEEHKVGVCSRNIDLKLDQEGNHFVNMFNDLGMRDKLFSAREKFGFEFAIQGEIMGPGIQGNREGFFKHEYFVYDIWNITDQKYLNAWDRGDICKFIGLAEVPDVSLMSFSHVPRDKWSIEWFLKYADRRSIHHKIAEGVVFKHLTYPEKSFKVINNNYLLKCDSED